MVSLSVQELKVLEELSGLLGYKDFKAIYKKDYWFIETEDTYDAVEVFVGGLVDKVDLNVLGKLKENDYGVLAGLLLSCGCECSRLDLYTRLMIVLNDDGFSPFESYNKDGRAIRPIEFYHGDEFIISFSSINEGDNYRIHGYLCNDNDEVCAEVDFIDSNERYVPLSVYEVVYEVLLILSEYKVDCMESR